MPELPEVETIKLGLQQHLIGQQIKSIQVLYSKPAVGAATQEQMEKLAGVKVSSLDRRGKVLIINLDNDQSLLVHLKMTGQMVLIKAKGERLAGGHPTESMVKPMPDASTRIIFEFSSGDKLYFNDQRKFGWIKIVPKSNVERDTLIARLGPEPLSNEFDVKRFSLSVKRHPKAPIKAVILDQSTVAGVGNIYADESLHLAKLHPARLASSLSDQEIKRLHQAIKDIIATGIKHGGTSFTHYVNALGGKGDYLKVVRVFRKPGEPCPVCGSPIKKIRLAGRGTHYCPKCQRLSLSNT